tara:strand:+ start:10374 stop:11573 length:1200 start_codon:yes stop_codon:yes gene_type:complete
MEFDVRIKKPNDTNEYYNTTMSSDIFKHITNRFFKENGRAVLNMSRAGFKSKDPLHEGIKSQLKSIFVKPRTTRYGGRKGHIPSTVSATISIKDFSIFFQKKSGRHTINGIYLSLDNMCDVIARVLYRSCFTDCKAELNRFLWSCLNIPENVSYVLENRLPFFFFNDYEKHDVRLNVQRIGPTTCAIEISDGVWGEISFKELDRYCNFYVHGQKRGSWPYTSPRNLFVKLIGREPTNAELNLMIAFLQQNRKQDIVEKRAYELINEMVEQRPDRFFPVWNSDNQLTTMFVRGNGYDWMLVCQNFKSTGTQNVSTYVWQPTRRSGEGNEPQWSGAICIDNANDDSSIGDQFAARAMALLNDNMTINIVHTIKSYILSEPNENRVDIDEEMRRVRNSKLNL